MLLCEPSQTGDSVYINSNRYYCCQSANYPWCLHEEVVHIDEKNQAFCIFHVPAGIPSIDKELFFRKLRAKLSHVAPNICDLSGTIFKWDIASALLTDNNRYPGLNLTNCIFEQNASFDKSVFAGPVIFRNSTFKGNVFFDSSEFNQLADFSDANFTSRESRASFIKTQFSKDVDFSRATFSSSITAFSSCFHSTVVFNSTVFEKSVDFSNSSFYRGAFFFKISFASISFNNVFISENLLVFEKVCLDNLSLLGSNVFTFSFVDCYWTDPNRDHILLDEINALNSRDNNSMLVNLTKTETLYRQLKRKYQNEFNEREASQWHYREKEVRRKIEWFRTRRPLSLLVFYWIACGYGEKPLRAGVVLLMLFLLCCFLLSFFGLESSSHSWHSISRIDLNGQFRLDINAIIGTFATAFQYVTFQKDPLFIPSQSFGDLVKAIMQIFIPLQTALFVLSIRNKYRR
jgi:hypothetical protein